MNPDDLFGIIRSRRSVRRYRPEPVPRALLERLLEAATWAPSAHNRQPWRFVVVQTLAVRRRLADAMAARWREDGGETVRVERSRARLGAAPALVVLCMTMADMDQYPDASHQQAERVMAIQSVAMAGQNLLLMAHAEGLGAVWMCAPLFCPGVVREVLSLPGDYEPLGLIMLGYPLAPEKACSKTRLSLESRALWR
jgi:coenzyme F420-0:L-glutamate ligase/coenzyme F420-1:gamma-L-glutamate ligase